MFDIQIQRQYSWDKKNRPPGGWQVYLPHSCNEWEIAEDGSTKEEAIAKLRAFIEEAQATLSFLEAAPDDWNDHYGNDVSMRFFDY